MDVSIIIVNYNTKELIKNCIKSIYQYTNDIEFEIIVSDNGSTDGSIEMLKSEFPNVILIENNANLGFGKANNKGLKIAKGKYIFYLNSDTVLLNNAVKIFYDYWEQSPNKNEIGALGCNLLDGEGKITHSGEGFPSKKKILKNALMDFLHILKLSVFFFLPESFSFTKKKSIKNETKKIIGDIDYVIGADLFLKNDKFALFDETFILYYEDSDLQLLMKENGLRRILIDGPKIQHLEHKSNKFNKKIDFFKSFGKINSMLSAIIYTKKHLNSKGLIFLLKFLTVLDFLNPFLFKKTKFYIKKIIKL
mgnify:FL=1